MSKYDLVTIKRLNGFKNYQYDWHTIGNAIVKRVGNVGICLRDSSVSYDYLPKIEGTDAYSHAGIAIGDIRIFSETNKEFNLIKHKNIFSMYKFIRENTFTYNFDDDTKYGKKGKKKVLTLFRA